MSGGDRPLTGKPGGNRRNTMPPGRNKMYYFQEADSSAVTRIPERHAGARSALECGGMTPLSNIGRAQSGVMPCALHTFLSPLPGLMLSARGTPGSQARPGLLSAAPPALGAPADGDCAQAGGLRSGEARQFHVN